MLFHGLVLAVASNPVVTRLVTGVPAFRRMARRFVAGDTLDDAVQAIRDLRRLGLLGGSGRGLLGRCGALVGLGGLLGSLRRLLARIGRFVAAQKSDQRR